MTDVNSGDEPGFLWLLRGVVADIDTYITDHPDLTLEELVEVLVALNRRRDEMKLIYDEVCRRVATSMNEMKEYHAPEGVTIEKKWAKSRTAWQHDRLAQEVGHRLALMSIDFDTGEITRSPEELVADLVKYLAPNYWRVGALKELGLNPDEYCEAGESKPAIIVRNAKQL